MAFENRYCKAAIKYYQAQKEEALAVLETYFHNDVGIADHSNLLDEVKKWTEKLTEAEENIKTLKKHFEPKGK